MIVATILLAIGWINVQRILAINCGDILTNSTGWISPPDTDGDGLYGFRTDCVWVIRVPDHKSLQIHFNEMDIEEGLMCGYDYVRILDGNTKVAHYCGTTIPPDITSEAKLVFVEFHSDNYINRKGFNATYTEIDDPTCGFLVWRMAGSFSSLDTDINGAHDFADCTWTIRETKNTEAIQVYVAKMDIPDNLDCEMYFIEMYSGEISLGKFCGTANRSVITSLSNVVYVHMYSPASNDTQLLVYFCSTDRNQEYGGILLQPIGFLNDVDKDNNGLYENNVNVVWTIVAKDDYVIKFEILNLSLEDSEDCRYDSLKVYDGIFEPDTAVLTYCGRDSPPVTIWSVSSALFVHFITDVTGSGLGFEARFVHMLERPTTTKNYATSITDADVETTDESTKAMTEEPTNGHAPSSGSPVPMRKGGMEGILSSTTTDPPTTSVIREAAGTVTTDNTDTVEGNGGRANTGAESFIAFTTTIGLWVQVL